MERRITLVLGKSGFGKTYLTRSVLIPQEPRVIVIDQRGEYEGQAFYDFNRMADFLETRPAFRAVWQGGQDYYQAVFHLAFALRDVCVFCEEADLIPCDGYYREAVYRGRVPYRIGIVALAQRPFLFSPALRSQATDVYCFNLSEPSDVQWVSTFFPDSDLSSLPPKTGLRYSLSGFGPSVTSFRLP